MTLSIFPNMTSKQPAPCGLSQVAQLIRSDERIAALTQSYRQTGSKSIKQECPLFAVAVVFEGGKGQEHIRGLTGLSLVDFDHVLSRTDFTDSTDAAKALNELKSKIIADPHTLMCYTTMSGNGLRVVFRYEPPSEFRLNSDDNDLSAELNRNLVGFYESAFYVGNAYYERLIGKPADGKCKNITRLSGLAHDPAVFLRPESEVVAFTAEEISAAAASYVKESKEQKQMQRIDLFYENVVRPKLEADGVKYGPGTHNDYVMRVGYMMAKKRYPRTNATEWALGKFPEYDGVAQVFKSCYDTTSQPAGNRESGGGHFASVEEIRSFLAAHILLRYNIITLRYEYLFRGNPKKRRGGDSPGKPVKEVWKMLDDRKVNTLWSQLSANKRVSKADLLNVVESNYTPPFHPFADYLERLPPWKEGDPDYIGELAATVRVRGEGDGLPADPSLFPLASSLRKWLVAMIAGWIDEDAVNNVILVFIGRQGAYKTTWFNNLLPPELRQYFYTKTNSKRMTKDDLIALSQYALICCEELDTMTPTELNQLKAAVTMQYINERAAYARYPEQRKHINTFCGTGNNPEFLNDPTGNRRWLPYEVESIVSPRDHPFNHRGIYAQAYALYKSGFRYWFTDEEIERQNNHNRRFEAPHLEQELVDLYFRIPTEAETGEFVSVARAMQLIGSNISQRLSAVKIGKAFADLGFRKVRTKSSRGFIAIVRTAEDIRAYQIAQSVDADGVTG